MAFLLLLTFLFHSIKKNRSSPIMDGSSADVSCRHSTKKNHSSPIMDGSSADDPLPNGLP